MFSFSLPKRQELSYRQGRQLDPKAAMERAKSHAATKLGRIPMLSADCNRLQRLLR